MDRKDSALVMLSGGQDSATCLAIAFERFNKLFTVSFDYGQKHKMELVYSRVLSKKAKAEKHFEIPLPSLSLVSKSSSLINKNISTSGQHLIDKNLPSSFLPNRNFIMLGLAASLAYELNTTNIFTGVCQTDYNGYPDCRNNTIEAIEKAISLSLNKKFTIYAPLMYKTKAETIITMSILKRMDWYVSTHTCYEGVRPPCNKCPACLAREKGFKESGFEDPLFTSEQRISLFHKGML